MDIKKKIECKKILVINLGGIGDVLLSIPALKALRAFYPDAELSLLITSRTYEVTRDMYYVNRVYIFNIEYGGMIPLNKILGNFATLIVLRKERFDLGINMRTVVSKISAKKMEVLFRIINPVCKAGRDTDGNGSFFDIKIPETRIGTKHEMEYDLEMVKSLGADVTDKTIEFKIRESDASHIDKLLRTENISKDDIIIGMHPGGMPSRRWPLENYVKTIDMLSVKLNCKILITGGPKEIELFDRLKKMVSHPIVNFANRVTIGELAALIEKCHLFISNDTGPIHLAAILKIPLIAIFGSGYITRFDPRYISDKVIVIYKGMDCSPCDKVTCESLKCLKAISPTEVTEAALALLEKYKSSGENR